MFAGATPAQPGASRLQRARSMLLSTFAAVAGHEPGSWERLLLQECGRQRLVLHWRGALLDTPREAAVRVAHALDMGPSGLQAWCATWHTDFTAPHLLLAASAACLLSGRESMLILGACCDGRGDDAGALIDAESWERMAVAGFDPDTEIRLDNCTELLASSGDLLNLPAGAQAGADNTSFLILGLKWHAPAGN
ncbi:MAG TPA: hypothetical protein VK505_09275 [Steroidobacteraceae bacterium]|nr:hypothetical protein [Steroidobacteraceae bacterium]